MTPTLLLAIKLSGLGVSATLIVWAWVLLL